MSERFALPEQWSRVHVAASLVNVPLSAGLCADFDDLPMVRAGSVVGLSVRLTSPAIDGAMAITITKNGVPQPLTIITTALSNTQGGRSIQALGVATFLPGDLIGVAVTTTAGWIPGPSVHAWVQVSEEEA